MNLNQHKFVTEYLRFGDQCIAYKNAYNSTATGKTIESAANRLMKHPEVAQAIADAQATIREQVEKEVAAELKGELLTMQKKRELLYQIATGEIHVLQYHKGKDCNTCTQYVTPTINQMLRAIHLDNKLAGHYPPVASPANGEVLAKEYLPGQIRMKQPRPNTDKQTQYVLSPAGGGVRLSVDGGGVLAQEKHNTKNHNNSQQKGENSPPGSGEPVQLRVSPTQLVEREDIGENADGIADNGGGRLAQEKQNMKNHNTPIATGTQQIIKENSFPVFREGGPANGGDGRVSSRRSHNQSSQLLPKKENTKNHNNSQQTVMPTPDPVAGATSGKPANTITSTALNNLLNTEINTDKTPRILQFRRQAEPVG